MLILVILCTQTASRLRLHFLAPSYAPIVAPGSRAFQSQSVPELTTSMFDRKNMLVAMDPQHGRYLTAATIYRGKINSKDAEAAIGDVKQKNSASFVESVNDSILSLEQTH